MILFKKNKPPLPKIWFGGKERGAALLVTFFVMGIALSIVLGISAILVSEIKVIRGMGYSVAAFYTADAGMEEVLYLDKKQILTEGATRGFCDICSSCSGFGCQNCQTTPLAPDGCDPVSCQNCQVSYYTEINGRRYNINSFITPTEESFKSYGTYRETTRAIELSFGTGEEDGANSQAPMIYNTSVVVSGGTELEIVADIYDPDGVESAEVHIQYPDENDYDVIPFPLYSGVTYKATWIGPEGFYYVDITSCDTNGYCSEKENI